jgi:hypothetical protein
MKPAVGLFLFIFILVTAACTHGPARSGSSAPDVLPAKFGPDDNETSQNIVAEYTPSEVEEPYPGQTIDTIFPANPTNITDFMGSERDGTARKFEQSGFTITTKDFMPVGMSKSGKQILRFKTKNEQDTYGGFLSGESRLLGPDSRQIYVVSMGPGGPCCTNYWIVDISTPKPRVIFRSEEFGSFREPMEIFDADGDGIYELVQMDTTFRYMNDDCGSCTPEPRAYFKYDPAKKQYLPTTGITEDFIKKYLKTTDEWLIEKQTKLDADGDPTTALEIQRRALSYAADLLFIGEEKKAWTIYDKYIHDPDIKAEIDFRLAHSAFYQYIRKHPRVTKR